MKFRAVLIISMLIASSATAYAQKPSGKTPVPRFNEKREAKERGQQVERSIKSDANVSLSVCVISGAIQVRGWDKNEVRARSNDAAELEFRRKDGTTEPSPATKLELFIADKAQGPGRANSCQSFSDINVSVPRGATVQLQTRDGDITVVDVATAYANTQNGDVTIERASKAVEAGTIGGGISLKDSSGRINIHSAGGNIEAINIRPVETIDTFDASSLGGDITLERVTHAQLDAHTLNGGVCMTGALAHGGRYSFRTISGDVTLTMPADASFQLIAKISQNAEIITDFPLTLKTEDATPAPTAAPAAAPAAAPTARPEGETPGPSPSPKAKPSKPTPKTKDLADKQGIIVEVRKANLRRITGVCGSGDAVINLASFSGTVHLRKQ
jgi:Putative adhesin